MYKLTIHERLETSGPAGDPSASLVGSPAPPGCGLTDLMPGMSFTINLRGDELNLRGCVLPACPDDFPAASQPLTGELPPVSAGGGTACLNRHRKVQLAQACEARRVVQLQTSNVAYSKLSDPTVSKPPYVALLRELDVTAGPEGAARCADPAAHFPPGADVGGSGWRCADVYAVTLEKQ